MPVLLAVLVLGCRSVHEVPLSTGTYRADELNAGPEMKGVVLAVDVSRRHAELRDGRRSTGLKLELLPRDQWRGDCGTMSGYSALQTATVTPRVVEVRGTTVSLESLSSACGSGVELHGDMPRRWLFEPALPSP
jgi:hypothetical protein